jgi:hypothetical protein
LRWIVDTTRRFGKRPFYDDDELEREAHDAISDFLLEKYGRVDYPITTDDLTVLIEKYAELDLYADLCNFGDGVDGVTTFAPGRRPLVQISETLSADQRRQNRLRTTLAHEFGHVRLHNGMYQFEAPGIPLFTHIETSEQVCKREHIAASAKADWMEFQAGVICTALLAPKDAVLKLIPFGSMSEDRAVDLVSSTFGISIEAAKVRLSRLGILTGSLQQRLL